MRHTARQMGDSLVMDNGSMFGHSSPTNPDVHVMVMAFNGPGLINPVAYRGIEALVRFDCVEYDGETYSTSVKAEVVKFVLRGEGLSQIELPAMLADRDLCAICIEAAREYIETQDDDKEDDV